MQIGEIAWEEFEKVGLRHFANLRKKTVGGNGRENEMEIVSCKPKCTFLDYSGT